MRSSLDSRSIHRLEGRVDKVESARITRPAFYSSIGEPRSQIKHGPPRSLLTVQLQQKFQKLQKEVRGQSFLYS